MTNLPPNKPATLFTNAELREIHQDSDKAEEFRSVYTQQIELLSTETSKLDGIFADFTNRSGVLITIAAFLSFLPPLKIMDEHYLPYFLLWSFPFLLAALGTYYFSSFRIQPVIKGVGFAPAGSVEALIHLRDRANYFDVIWRRYHELYTKVLTWNKCTGALIYGYIVSMSANFYIFVFYGKPALCTSVVIAMLSGIVVAAMILWSFVQSTKGVVVGEPDF